MQQAPVIRNNTFAALPILLFPFLPPPSRQGSIRTSPQNYPLGPRSRVGRASFRLLYSTGERERERNCPNAHSRRNDITAITLNSETPRPPRAPRSVVALPRNFNETLERSISREIERALPPSRAFREFRGSRSQSRGDISKVSTINARRDGRVCDIAHRSCNVYRHYLRSRSPETTLV